MYRRVDDTISLITALGHPSVLDVGCGSGRTSLAFAEAGAAHVHGIDFSAPMLELARKYVTGAPQERRVSFEHADLLTWDAGGKSWDLVVALGLFDYFADLASPLARMHQLTRRAVCFSIRHPTLIRMPIRKLRYQAMKCPIYFYRRRTIDRACRAAGFTEVDLAEGGNGSYFVRAYK